MDEDDTQQAYLRHKYERRPEKRHREGFVRNVRIKDDNDIDEYDTKLEQSHRAFAGWQQAAAVEEEEDTARQMSQEIEFMLNSVQEDVSDEIREQMREQLRKEMSGKAGKAPEVSKTAAAIVSAQPDVQDQLQAASAASKMSLVKIDVKQEPGEPLMPPRMKKRRREDEAQLSDSSDYERPSEPTPTIEFVREPKARIVTEAAVSAALAQGRRQRQTVTAMDDDGEIQRRSHQEAVYRGRAGVLLTRDEFIEQGLDRSKRRQKPAGKAREKEERMHAEDFEWGGGLKQLADKTAQKKIEDEIVEGKFTRYEIDEGFDEVLKSQHRWGDPLGGTTGADGPLLVDPTSADGGTASIRGRRPMRNSEGKLRCRFPTPPNRYLISPGMRWDGRIRGNGFEEKFMAARAAALSMPQGPMSAMD